VSRELSYICIHTHPFNGPFFGTTQVSRYQKGKTNLDFTEARDSEWQWHQLGRMQVCISLQTDNHASNPPLCVVTNCNPPPPKDVTTLTCEMQNFFICLKICCIPSNVGGCERTSCDVWELTVFLPLINRIKTKGKTKEDLERGCSRGLSST